MRRSAVIGVLVGVGAGLTLGFLRVPDIYVWPFLVAVFAIGAAMVIVGTALERLGARRKRDEQLGVKQ